MLALFVLPFAVRNDPMTYEWVFYRALGSLRRLMLLAPETFFQGIDNRACSGSWATWKTTQSAFHYELPTDEQMGRVERLLVEGSSLSRTEERFLSPNKVWAETLSSEIPELTAAVRRSLGTAKQLPEALILWSNCPSAAAAAAESGIAVVHNELGPLRRPWFKPTAYFDFKGVNGRTSSLERWMTFKSSEHRVPILSRTRLLQLLGAQRWAPSVADRQYRAGVALQVPTDSNLIAFGHGNANLDAILAAQRYFGKVLVRPHPAMSERYGGLSVDWDEGTDPADFLSSIEHLVTVNSSMALEAMLRGVPTTILGDSPFAYGSIHPLKLDEHDDREMTYWLNWIVFGYLMPEYFLFDEKYYKWRLRPSTDEISVYLAHFAYWTEGSESFLHE